MPKRQKRVLAVHDISGVGKCSLTVALPIISAAGLECSVLPTAVLSTHTGGFTGYTYRDLTEDIAPITAHWEQLEIKPDGIYSGFLGSLEQIGLVADLFGRLKTPETLILVDPVMADNGVLYSIFDKDYPKAMAKLCAKADLIMPNITEAALLTGTEYKAGPYDMEYIEKLLARLAELGAKKIVLTGVSFTPDELGAMAFDAQTEETAFARGEAIEGYYHGTGDVFGSVLTAALISGRALPDAAQMAVDFTVESIRRTKDADTERRYGVNFEAGLWKLGKELAD